MINKFKFIDLFAGIGGFHIAMHDLGGECVFASEIDKFARQTYECNFKNISPKLFLDDRFNDDIRKISPEQIPDFDVLCAGFPCQPFSQAGYKRGFNDNHNSERGNLFFNISEIIAAKKPKAFFLENVRGLSTHDNGNTLKVIRSILEDELNYSIYIKIVRATDYGLPQHRPRTFIIGFRDESFLKGFNFPPKKELKFNMSDVWEGHCDREIGFTLRVGGRGSSINDRRNWDSYRVNGKVVTLTEKEGKKMQGFPDWFKFNVSNTQAMKQLGNSVAIDAIRSVGSSMLDYMFSLSSNEEKKEVVKMNKGEWTEPYVFIRLINEKKIFLSNPNLTPNRDFLNISKITNHNINYEVHLNKEESIIKDKASSNKISSISNNLINNSVVNDISNQIINSKERTFEIKEIRDLEDKFKISLTKGGSSSDKSDIILDINNKNLSKQNQGFGIKSFLGSSPTLLNASSNTNFIYRIENFDKSKLDEVNQIKTKSKIKDRIEFIKSFGGEIIYEKSEKDIIENNLKKVDLQMPLIIGELLYLYYTQRISKVSDAVKLCHENGKLNKKVDYGDLETLIHITKKFLVDSMLGFFAGTKWDGKYTANGSIVVKKDLQLLGFHVIQIENLKSYLFENIRFDTPSSTRHRFGSLYLEKNNKLYFKLNLQLRFT